MWRVMWERSSYVAEFDEYCHSYGFIMDVMIKDDALLVAKILNHFNEDLEMIYFVRDAE